MFVPLVATAASAADVTTDAGGDATAGTGEDSVATDLEALPTATDDTAASAHTPLDGKGATADSTTMDTQ